MKKLFIYTLVILLVISFAFMLLQERDSEKNEVKIETDYEVIIVGAGAAGLSAARELEQAGISYLVIEASDTYGGRLKEANDFIDLPLDLGAEWIHENPIILEEMTQDENILDKIDIITYNPRKLLWFEDEELSDQSQELSGYKEYKFKDTTWFERHPFLYTLILNRFINLMYLE